jgi:hypothetical protein
VTWWLSHRRNCPDAVAAANTLSSVSCGGLKTPPEGHMAMLICLLDTVMDHPDVKSTIDTRIEHCDELRRMWMVKQKEFKEQEKQMMNERIWRASQSQASAEDQVKEEQEPAPELEIPSELLETTKDKREEEERLNKIDDIEAAHKRAYAQWEKRQQARQREEDREEEKRAHDERRYIPLPV